MAGSPPRRRSSPETSWNHSPIPFSLAQRSRASQRTGVDSGHLLCRVVHLGRAAPDRHRLAAWQREHAHSDAHCHRLGIAGLTHQPGHRPGLVASPAFHDRPGAHPHPSCCRLVISERSPGVVVGGRLQSSAATWPTNRRRGFGFAGRLHRPGTHLPWSALPFDMLGAIAVAAISVWLTLRGARVYLEPCHRHPSPVFRQVDRARMGARVSLCPS